MANEGPEKRSACGHRRELGGHQPFNNADFLWHALYELGHGLAEIIPLLTAPGSGFDPEQVLGSSLQVWGN